MARVGGGRQFGRVPPLAAAIALLFCGVVAYTWLNGSSSASSAPGSTQRQQRQRQRQQQVPQWGEPPANWSLPMSLPAWGACGVMRTCEVGGGQLASGDADASEPYTGQWQEDEWLYNHFFYQKRNGFYLEMGAMDGIQLSNTLWLQRAAGWRGLLIEACPEQYAHLARNRPNDVTVNAAACGKFETVHWVSKAELGGIWEFFSDELRPADVDPAALPAVPCVPLQYVLDLLGIRHIDLWSLDVEGAELAVLSTLDWGRTRVDALVVETDGVNATKDAAVVALLEGQGFIAAERGPKKARWTRNGQNTFFVHKDFKRSHAPGADRMYVEDG